MAEKKNVAPPVNVQLTGTEQEVQKLTARVVEQGQSLQALSVQLGEYNEIKNSRAWRIIQTLWRVRTFLMPHGSMREHFVRQILNAIRTVRHGGIRFSSMPKVVTKEVKNQPAHPSPSQIKASSKQALIYADLYQEMLQSNQSALMGSDYVSLSETIPLPEDSPVKLIAFYLPQFHPFPENDVWWGRGFTEWTNVSKAIPQFVGHYQPHLPGELGFYDLRLPEVQRRQVELAKKYGLHGFCFHYYWFNGKRLLEKPLDQFMSDPEIDFPFCICWANENWTRRWDGQEDDILIAQTHSLENDIQFIKDLEPVLRHPKYIRINGRPLIIVYRVPLLENAADTAAAWRKYLIEKGLGDPYLVAAQTFGFNDPSPIGFDASVGFPPHNIVCADISNKMQILNTNFSGKIYRYNDMVSYSIIQGGLKKPYKEFITIMPSWDNTPRKLGKGHAFAFSTPFVYKQWLEWAARHTMQNNDPEERFVFVNAWNEWGEGAYLEPDRKYGYAYLQATAEALLAVSAEKKKEVKRKVPYLSPSKVIKQNDTAVIQHIFYPELWQEFEHYLANLEGSFDLFVSIPESVNFDTEQILRKYPNAYIYRCENRGRDIAPFLKIFPLIEELGYSYGLKLHTKKSVHREDGLQWLEDILEKLIGSKESVFAAKGALLEKNIGMVAPAGHLLPAFYYWGATDEAKATRKNVNMMAEMAGLTRNNSDFYFVAGSMYWFRPSALKLLCDIKMDPSYFEPENGQKDGTFAHAVERFYGLAIVESGYQIIEVGQKGEVRRPSLADINQKTDYPFAVATLDGRPFTPYHKANGTT